MNEEKRKILDFLKDVTRLTNITQLLKDVGVNKVTFHKGNYSLERMLEVKKELQKRLEKLSKM